MGGRAAATDLELLRAHVAGDRDAFAELFHRHRDRLWAVALRTLGDREEAADALQDALLSAHRAAGRFRGDSAVTTWLHRIVVNACLDRIRRRQAHPTVPLPDGNRAEDGTGGLEPAAPATDHDTVLVVREALAALPLEQRAALVLVDVQGYPVAEVARILGVAEGTVKSRCAGAGPGSPYCSGTSAPPSSGRLRTTPSRSLACPASRRGTPARWKASDRGRAGTGGTPTRRTRDDRGVPGGRPRPPR